MKRIIIQSAKALGAVLAILIIIAIGFEVSNMRAMAKSSSVLNEFCGSLPVGALQSEVSVLVQQKKDFRFIPMDDLAFISLHTCHCTVRFTEKKVSNVSTAICNG